MAENLADQGWIVFVRSEASGAAVYLVGLATERDSEIAVRGRYTNKAIKIEQLVRLSKANVVGFGLRVGEVRPWQWPTSALESPTNSPNPFVDSIRAREKEGLLKRALFISSLSAHAILNTFDTVARPLPGSFAAMQAWWMTRRR
jgi:hypothetical protein